MCGIMGFNWDDASLISKMQSIMKYRGPDGKGHYNDKLVSLGHLRLSIIDISKRGAQPMSNEDGSISVVFNGEIYNFKEVRQELIKKGHRFFSETDTEVIVHAYEEYGPDCVKLFNGMFAFCIYDSIKKKLFIARDRLGIKPVYYFYDGKRFIFASEIKAILLHDVKKRLNKFALDTFLIARYNFLRETFFDDIYKLLPGEYVLFDLDTSTMSRKFYWTVNFNESKKSLGYFEKRLKSLLYDSVKSRLMSDVPLGAFLSGGVDSSTIVALMSKIKKQEQFNDEIKTFSVGFNVEKDYDDIKYAKIVADTFGTNHKELLFDHSAIKHLPQVIWHLDSPLSAPDAVPTYLMSKEAKKSVTVVLTGNGADEMFVGYEHIKFINFGRYIKWTPNLLRKDVFPFLIDNFPKSILNKFFKYPNKMGDKGIERAKFFIGHLHDDFKAYNTIVSIFDEKERKDLLNFNTDKYFTNTNAEILKYFNNDSLLLNKILTREIKHFLVDCVLAVGDRMSMASSIESRVPFLDHRLAELSFKIPLKYKLRGIDDKYILKKAVSSILPKQILKRTKQGFHVPIDIWLKNDLKDLSNEILDPNKLKTQGIFKPSAIKKINSQLNSSKLYSARQLWCLISFQLWYEMFFNETSPKKLMRSI